MKNISRGQILFVVGIIAGLILGKLIKNYKVVFFCLVAAFAIYALVPKKRK